MHCKNSITAPRKERSWSLLRRAQVNELKSSIRFQLKKVLCMGVAIGNVGMEEKEIYVNTQARGLPFHAGFEGLKVSGGLPARGLLQQSGRTLTLKRFLLQ